MPMRPYRRLLGSLGVLALLFSVWAGMSISQGGQPKDKDKGGLRKPEELIAKPFSTASCQFCHDKPDPKKDESQDVKLGNKPVYLSRLNEYSVWSVHDKHKDAHKVLSSQRGKDMGKILGYDAAKDHRCTNCHGSSLVDPQDPKQYALLSEGVNCAVCHGQYPNWVREHWPIDGDNSSWLALTRKEKEGWGMTDMWDPNRRAEVCLSCHLGSVAEKKVVTHEMYAAGHPPLPGIEISSFSNQMPRHWQLLAEKKPKVLALLHLKPDDDDVQQEQTKTTVIAGLVAFRQNLRLLADLAEESEKNQDKARYPWPELATFDCYGCHHDLKYPGWRQDLAARKIKGTPGRPMMRPWSTALVELALMHVGRGGEAASEKMHADLHAGMKKLHEAYNAKPFGHTKQVIQAARDLEQWSDGLLAQIIKQPLDRAMARDLLGSLGKVSEGRLVDWDSARQLAWAFNIIQDETWKDLGKKPGVQELQQALSKELRLKLPVGQVEIAKDYLAEALDAINDYNPRFFQKKFAELYGFTKP